MRRFLLPAVVLAVVIAASLMAGRANDAADPTGETTTDAAARVSTPLLNVRRAPEWLRQPASDDALMSAVTAATAGFHENDVHCLSVRRDGEPIVDILSVPPDAETGAVDPTTGLIPGAVQRLSTLEAFGALSSAGFSTDVVRSTTGVITDGVLEGDLWLVGGADPVLSTATYIDRFGDGRAFTSLDDLAAQTVAALVADGITAIDGQLVADHSKYGPERVDYSSETWTSPEIGTNDIGALSSLIVNSGFDSFGETVDAAARARPSSPARHAAGELLALVEAAGITVSGGVGAGDQPDAIERIPVASISSPSLDDIAARVYVDGTTAEMLFLEIGIRSGQDGDQLSALLLSPGALDEAGVLDEADVFTVRAQDGSGLSLLNRARCDVLTNILDKGDESLAVRALPAAASSPVAACVPAGLTDLQVYADARPEVSSIVGRAVAPNGDVITFSMLVNWAPDAETGELLPRDACDGVFAALLDAIAAHPEGDLTDFSPLGLDEPA